MTPPEVRTEFAMPDPGTTPLDLTQLFQLANRLVSSTILGPYVPNIIQTGTPSPDDQDKIWLELDSQARPIAIKIFWHGHWRRVYNGMLGEIRGFSGDPGYNTTGNFNPDGLGNIGGAYDGWHICNGKNGTPDMSNQFLCGANMNPPTGTPLGYSQGRWKTLIADGIDDTVHEAGGQWREVLQEKNIPLPVLQQTFMNRYSIGGGGETVDNGGLLWGVNETPSHKPIPGGTPPDINYTYPPSGYKGNPTPEGVFVGPPFYALAWIIFVGYA